MYTPPKNIYKRLKDLLPIVALVIFSVILLAVFFSGKLGGLFIFLPLIYIYLGIDFLIERKKSEKDNQLAELKEELDHLFAKNTAIDHHCDVTVIYMARIIAELGKNNISLKFNIAAKQVNQYISYNNAVQWMREEANYTQRFTLVALIFKLAEEGFVSTTRLNIHKLMNLGKADYKQFESKEIKLQKLAKQEQNRKAILIQQCEMAMGQLVGKMLRLNAKNYPNRSYNAIKSIAKLGSKKHNYTFFQKALQLDTLSINEAIESVCLGLKPKDAKKFVRLMFELAVEDDGIKNDEWRILLQLLVQMKFDEQTQANFITYYQSLRTEFNADDFQKKEYKEKLVTEYRDILGVTEESSAKEIHDAYHRLALKYHPDLPKNAGHRKECEQYMAKINNAYTHLVIKKNTLISQ